MVSNSIFVVGVVEGVVLRVPLVAVFSVHGILLGLVVASTSLLGRLVHFTVSIMMMMMMSKRWKRRWVVGLGLEVVGIIRWQGRRRLQVVATLVVVRLGSVVLVVAVGWVRVVAGVLYVGYRLGSVLVVVGVLGGRTLEIRNPHFGHQHSSLGPPVRWISQCATTDRQHQQQNRHSTHFKRHFFSYVWSND